MLVRRHREQQGRPLLPRPARLCLRQWQGRSQLKPVLALWQQPYRNLDLRQACQKRARRKCQLGKTVQLPRRHRLCKLRSPQTHR